MHKLITSQQILFNWQKFTTKIYNQNYILLFMYLLRYLLEQGADPHVMDVEMNISLHWAAFSGSKTITDLLLSAGCNVNQANAIGNFLLTRLGFKEQ